MRFRDVRVVGQDGSQIGIMQTRQALNQAREQGFDLVLVAGNAEPPVVRITDYGRHKYETAKREKENRKQKTDQKGIKIGPHIAENDLKTLEIRAHKFLSAGHKVRVVCMFRPRELPHANLGKMKMEKFADNLAEVGVVERAPSLEGRQMIMFLNPRPQTKPKKDAKDQNKQDGSEAIQDHGDGEDHSTEERE